MNLSALVRQTHRWLSVLFTLAVIITTIALNQDPPIEWVSYVPLFPLALLFLSGVYLYFLPYVGRRRDGHPTHDTGGSDK